MFVFKKNQIIITALVVMIGAAGYLNYIDSNGKDVSEVVLTDESDISGMIPEEADVAQGLNDEVSIAVNAEVTETATGADQNVADSEQAEPGAAVFVNSSNDSSYFVQAKLDREQARAKQKTILTEMINNSNIAQEKKAQCADSMLQIQQRIEKESAAEAMIEAKGFKEVYVRIDDDTVDVVVNKEALSEAEIAQIEDIVKRKTGVSAEKIRISPIKK